MRLIPRLLFSALTAIAAIFPGVSHAAVVSAPDTIARPDSTSIKLGNVSVVAKGATRRVAEGAFTVNALSIAPSVNLLTSVRDIVDHSAGIKVRREGGMGSDFDLSINGLSGNSIRYFIDGMPLDAKGSGMTLDNIPLNTIERVELYKGVVPAYLGADALGGAVNIVTRTRRRNFIDAAYGGGSFHTQTADVTGQWFIPHTVVAIRPTFSLNSSKNDYKMHDVEVWDEAADRFVLTDRRRFHDDYLSILAQIEAGVSNVGWADRFTVSGSFSKVDKELQTGAMQNKVYGEAERNARSWNVAAVWSRRWGSFSARINASHTWDRSVTTDSAWRKYSWDGSWIPSTGNELTNRARSIRVYNRPLTVVSAGADYSFNPHHNLALNYSLNRRGNRRYDRIDDSFEPSNDVVTKHIISLTYSQEFLDQRLQNSLFVKQYVNATDIRQTDNIHLTDKDRFTPKATKSYWGGGFGSRYTIFQALAVKLSMEHSVRLPLSRELLGNGTTVLPNLAIRPEESNNFNLGLFGTWWADGDNELRYEVNGFIRHVENYIRARVSEREGMMQYANEPAIDIKGFDADLTYIWRSALRINLNGSWSDARDLKKFKTDGNPSATYKNRVPNRPWFFANAEASYTWRDLMHRRDLDDRLRLSLSESYIHWYYLNWEAYGAASSKARIPTQWMTDLALTYSWLDERYNISLSVTNLFDRIAYDNYMLQKPGRAFFAKFRIFL